jgi:hypothetical protein
MLDGRGSANRAERLLPPVAEINGHVLNIRVGAYGNRECRWLAC